MFENLQEGDIIEFTDLAGIIIVAPSGKKFMLTSYDPVGVILLPVNQFTFSNVIGIYRPLIFSSVQSNRNDYLNKFKNAFLSEFFLEQYQSHWDEHLEGILPNKTSLGNICYTPEIRKPYCCNWLRMDRWIDRDSYYDVELIEHLMAKTVGNSSWCKKGIGGMITDDIIMSTKTLPIFKSRVSRYNEMKRCLSSSTNSTLERVTLATLYNSSLTQYDTSITFKDMIDIEYKSQLRLHGANNEISHVYSHIIKIYNKEKKEKESKFFKEISPIAIQYKHSLLGEITLSISTKPDVAFETKFTELGINNPIVSFDNQGQIIKNKSNKKLVKLVMLSHKYKQLTKNETFYKEKLNNSCWLFSLLTRPYYTRKINEYHVQSEETIRHIERKKQSIIDNR